MTHACQLPTLLSRVARAATALIAAGMTAGAQAAVTDIAQTPLIVTTASLVKPNIMLLMDNSGSMGWTHMPDEIETVTGATARRSHASPSSTDVERFVKRVRGRVVGWSWGAPDRRSGAWVRG